MKLLVQLGSTIAQVLCEKTLANFESHQKKQNRQKNGIRQNQYRPKILSISCLEFLNEKSVGHILYGICTFQIFIRKKLKTSYFFV